MRAKDAILDLFDECRELTIKEIINRLEISKQMTHYVINQLLIEKKVEKVGQPPKTLYRRISRRRTAPAQPLIITDTNTPLKDDDFLQVTDRGDLLEGQAAFAYWCRQRSLPVDPTLVEYRLIRQRYARHRDSHGFVDGLEKLRQTLGTGKIWLDQLYYLDFNEIKKFGKTRLGMLVHHAKQSQSKLLMSLLSLSIARSIEIFFGHHQPDAIGFIPPTIRREVQLMKYVQTQLNVPYPILEIRKINGLIPIPQDSLSTLDERKKNANNTFAVTDYRTFRHVVLIDDIVGSGATLNQIAAKILKKGIADRVTGLAIVGRFDGLEGITDN